MIRPTVIQPGNIESELLSLFSSDEIAEHQIGELSRPKQLDAERRLMFATLEDAVDVMRKNASAKTQQGRAAFAEAESWVLERNSSWLFSFDNVCAYLGLDSEYMRDGITRHIAVIQKTAVNIPPKIPAKKGKRNAIRRSHAA